MRIAHLSDLHVFDSKGVRLRDFLTSRRVLGMLNLLSIRKSAHSTAVLERLLEDLLETRPDHVVVTGDLSNLALESEFDRVASYLRYVFDQSRVSVIPGNHDYYTWGAVRGQRFEKTFYPYMFPQFTDLDVDLYPYDKLLGPVSIFGLRSATQTIPPGSYGEVDRPQLDRLIHIVQDPKYRNTFKIALVHHYFHAARTLNDRIGPLRNRHEVAEVLVDQGFDLVLHGHDHVARLGWLGSGPRRIPVIGAGSATATDPRPHRVGRYNIYTIEDGRLADIEVRRFHPETQRFVGMPR